MIRDFENQQKTFFVRFYKWALSEVLADLQNGFPLLRVIGDSLVVRFLRHVEKLKEEEKINLCQGLVKRFHPAAVAMTNDRISSAEALQIRAFDRAELSDRQKVKRSKSGIRRLLVEYLPRISPSLDIHWFRHICQMQGKVGKWEVRTDIDTGGSYCVLTYRHSVLLSEELVLCENISILNWYGISGQTEWSMAMEDEEILFGFKLVFLRFVDALPSLLTGDLLP